jgi:hypothetical protein
MVDFQELEILKAAHDAASEASSIHEKPSSVASSPSSAASTVVPMSTSTQAATGGPSAADATNSFCEELLELQGGQSPGTKNCRQTNPV